MGPTGPGRIASRTLVDVALRTPLYHQVYVVLRSGILEGTYADGSRLPAEHDLCTMFDVSRITVRRALAELQAEGLLRRTRGSGTVVTNRRKASGTRVPLEGMLENLIAMGLETQASVLEFGWVVPSADVAAAMGAPPGALVQRAVRVRSTKDGPFSHLTTYVPERVGRSILAEDLGAHPLLTLLERSGVKVASADQTIGATLADAQTAMRLGVDVGSALLTLTRTVRDDAGQVVEYLQALYRPDRYQYQMSLARVDAAEGGRVWTPWTPTADAAAGRRRRAVGRRGGGRGA